MFGFLKERKAEKDAADKIGVEIHRQIMSAFQRNEAITGTRIPSFFTVGYLYGFVRIGFTTLGINGEQAADKWMKHICDGVLPGRLWESFGRLLAALELAKSLNKEDEIKLFEVGIEAGAFDAGAFNPFSNTKASNLAKYLVGDDIEYSPLPE